jgi:hypothetical protein
MCANIFSFLKKSRTFPGQTFFCSIGTGRHNRGKNGWGVMLTTTFYLKFSKGRDKNCLAEKRALEKNVSEVEEITDSRGEELADKELIQLEETKCLQKLKLMNRKNDKSSRNCSQRSERS